MAGKKTTNHKKTSNRKSTKKGRNNSATILEIFSIFCICLYILLFISILGLGGKVGNFFGGLLFGVFGILAYIIPIYLLLVTLFVLANYQNKFAYLKLTVLILFLLFMDAFVTLCYDGSLIASASNAFSIGKLMHTGGGALGALIAGLLVPNFGVAGAYVIDVSGILICVLLFFEKSLFAGLKSAFHSSDELRAKTRLDIESKKRRKYEEKQKRIAALRQQALEEKEALENSKRSNRKVSGVSFDTKIENPDLSNDDMKEVYSDLPYEEMQTPSAENQVSKKFEMEQPVEEINVAPVVEQRKPRTFNNPTAPVKEDVETLSSVSTEKSIAENASGDSTSVESELQKAASTDQAPYEFPPISLLKPGNSNKTGASEKELNQTADRLEEILRNFGVNVTVTDVSCGPSVTRYELQPEMGVKVSKIVGLADDIKLNLAAADIRIEAPIPGKAAVGIEVPNKENATVMLRELIESKEFESAKTRIPFPAGKDIAGKVIISDIGKMPHVLIAGATGSGKSVCINTIVMSIIYKANPEDVKLIMIDPKVVELSVYNGIPHLMIPVVTDPKKAAGALAWAVAEMTDRYKKFAAAEVRDLKGYNAYVKKKQDEGDEELKKMPQIIIIVDELADLMMVAPGDVEDAICRLAQLARAAGIHLILATQRPSVNVITGLIKANMPSRVAFAVSSGVDSRTILDMNGAEKLLGKGDMLFYPQGYQKPIRVQGPFVSDEEVSKVVEFLKEKNQNVALANNQINDSINQFTLSSSTMAPSPGASTEDGRDVYFEEAGKFLIEKERGSIGMLQRMFKIGFNRAARIMDQLEEAGVVGPEEGTKPRKILMSLEEFQNMMDNAN